MLKMEMLRTATEEGAEGLRGRTYFTHTPFSGSAPRVAGELVDIILVYRKRTFKPSPKTYSLDG